MRHDVRRHVTSGCDMERLLDEKSKGAAVVCQGGDGV